ncbi:hypothetical protein C8R43DRAFT_1132379 [Mycena crocata]|nr:hypothetical protein C8R43DRAFT_1132379 [Mycena crocata]
MDSEPDILPNTPPGSPPPRAFSVPPGDGLPRAEEPGAPASPQVWTREDVGIIHLTKEARKRHKKGEEKAKTGKVSWVWGTKLAFFASRKDEWLQAVASEEGPGAFYTRMARLYALKYPASLKDDEDLERDILDPPDELADIVVNYTPEEARKESVAHKHLRNRLGQWYRHQYGSLVKTGQTAFVKIFSGALDVAPPKPGRPQLMHFYSRKFYEDRLQERFVTRMESMRKRAEYTGEAEPKALAVLPIVTKEAWEDETVGFQEEVKEALEREYKVAIKGWEASLADSPTRTPEEMAATLENAAFYLQPFVDAIMERFGMCASVFLCGPMGKNGGAIGMQSVHAGKTKGLAPVSWPLFDRVGFSELEKSMVAFGRDCFSEAECRARATAELATAPGRGVGNVSSSSAAADGDAAAAAGSNRPEMASGSGVTSARAENGEGEDSAGAGGAGADDAGAMGECTSGGGATATDYGGAGAADTNGDDAATGVGGAQPQEGEGAMRTEEEEAALIVQKRIETMWQREDRAGWWSELSKVHAALERGKHWGIEWARCVRNFFDFEASHGYDENGGESVPMSGRPEAVQRWKARQRLWFSPMTITDIGAEGQDGTFAADWWNWWRGMQPEEREWIGGMLTCPSTEWTEMRTYFGRNGLLQVMATLWWWGSAVGDDDPLGRMNWSSAVEDVAWAFEEMLAAEKEREKESDDEEKAACGGRCRRTACRKKNAGNGGSGSKTDKIGRGRKR